MVFPSRGCITCRKRRIKCDSVHPTCGRCNKASRSCVWDENEEAGLVFKSENAFAQGKPRRPWKAKERDAKAGVETSASSPDLSVSSTPSSVPEEDEAFRFWLENFMFRDDEIPEFVREYSHYIITYRDKTQPGSSLHLAVSALSHAAFGRAMQDEKAIQDAESLFSRSIAKMQTVFRELTRDNIHEILVTAMSMAFYENIMYGHERHHSRKRDSSSSWDPDITGSRFWENICHHEGAAGLLKLRQERGWTPDLSLERAARRQLVRTCILRGTLTAPWLQDGAEFGEKGPVLDIDSIMVRVASLRSRSLHIFLPKGERFSSQLSPIDIASEARDLDIALESWSRNVPEDWKFSTHQDPLIDATFDGLIHTYASHGHATIWNRYRAVHIIINSVRKRALSIASHCSSQSISTNMEQELCLEKISLLSTDLCRCIPFFIASQPVTENSPPKESTSANDADNATNVRYEILPKLATLLAWPLTLAVSTDAVPEPQKQWLKVKLKSIARSLGDSILETVAEQSEFKF
ncbi:uncharacterized protein GGS22DRAFT_81726 [Annulohypoxylon maeteangense]|uniref:uncharacterized protein n=1 Tax=Annulohypoxylon maeteangense TaxID=1927788 RepID=UPI002007BBD0|nr:uncharacterized protein GGS22DRAFT_81726 [Annulohypoxylon maeteangense]KAI0880670.1 hypothetical protein GGS22DRAFT_81726 [Annulohypoxylon maeteangense]